MVKRHYFKLENLKAHNYFVTCILNLLFYTLVYFTLLVTTIYSLNIHTNLRGVLRDFMGTHLFY